MFCCMLLYVHSSIAIILMGKRELIALLNLSSWCLVMVERLFLTVPRGCLQFVIVVFSDHTHLLFRKIWLNSMYCKIFIYVHKNLFLPQTSDLLEKLALIFLHNFHRKRSLLKLSIKKLSQKINVKNTKIEFRRRWPVKNSINQCVCKQVRLRFSV